MNDDIEPLIEMEPDLEQLTSTPKCKESERQRIECDTKEFLRRKGKVVELAPDPTIAKTSRF